MPCRCDTCPGCGGFDKCICGTPELLERRLFQSKRDTLNRFDWEGACCDLLTLLKTRRSRLLKDVDKKVLQMWARHQELEAGKR